MKEVKHDPSEFYEEFRRSQPLLYLIADVVLGCPEQVEEAIHNCCQTASVSPRRLQRGNSFHSWLLRVLIDEALLILHQRKDRAEIGEEAA